MILNYKHHLAKKNRPNSNLILLLVNNADSTELFHTSVCHGDGHTIENIHTITNQKMMWCEQKLLVNRFPLEKGEIPLAIQSLCSGFSTGELDLLESMLERRCY